MKPVFAFLLEDQEEINIVTNKGDLCDAYSNGDYIITEYYQDRFTEKDTDGDYPPIRHFMELSKLYSDDFCDDKKVTDKHINQCLFVWCQYEPEDVIKIKLDGIGYCRLIELIRHGHFDRFFVFKIAAQYQPNQKRLTEFTSP